MRQDFSDKCILVLGLGLSGKAACHFLLKRNAKVFGADSNQEVLDNDPEIANLKNLGLVAQHEQSFNDLSSFDFIVTSPGISSFHPLYQKALEQSKEIIGEIELASREITQKCLAVTGTNGKTTVTSLVTHVLNESNISAIALGNIGEPLCSALDDQKISQVQVLVLELSSFQLECLESRFIDAAALLNITPDHLDRYASMQEYAKAKMSILRNLKEDSNLYVEEKCFSSFFESKEDTIQSYGYDPVNPIYTDKSDLFINGIRQFNLPKELQGKKSHNLENFIAAFLLCKGCGVTESQFLKAYASFKKPSHRLEMVKTIEGVNYIDDSKGTNIDAVIRAVESITGNIVLIAGGVDKGFPYNGWILAFRDRVKVVLAIGQAKEKIQRDIGSNVLVELCETLQEAVLRAKFLSQEGETVLLSPGCSSFDMFKDYAHRGDEFKRLVNQLHEEIIKV